MRHTEGKHLDGTFNLKRDGKIGPPLTGEFSNGEYHGGKGQAFRRCVRQLNEMNITPDLIVCSPQLRAIETACYARMNRTPLPNGKTLREIPIQILKKQGISLHEQTRMLDGQGSIYPAGTNISKTWPSYRQIRDDPKLHEAVRKALSETPRQPEADPRGTALPRARKIWHYLQENEKFFRKIVLIIAHDGICRDIITAKTGKSQQNTFGLGEIRDMRKYSDMSNSWFGSKKKTTRQSRSRRA